MWCTVCKDGPDRATSALLVASASCHAYLTKYHGLNASISHTSTSGIIATGSSSFLSIGGASQSGYVPLVSQQMPRRQSLLPSHSSRTVTHNTTLWRMALLQAHIRHSLLLTLPSRMPNRPPLPLFSVHTSAIKQGSASSSSSSTP